MAGLRRVFDVAAAIAVVAAITALVRPGSNGPALVSAIGQAFVNAAAGTVGSTITPDAQIPGAGAAGSSPDANPVPATGTALGPPLTTGGYQPRQYDIPSGAHQRAYF